MFDLIHAIKYKRRQINNHKNGFILPSISHNFVSVL